MKFSALGWFGVGAPYSRRYNSEVGSVENGLDIFGNALLSYSSGNSDAALLVHTEGFEPYELPVSVFFRPADYYPIDKLALTLCKGKVLDIGAGVGEQSIYLQNNGFDITALDVSAAACRIMTARGINSVINQDIFESRLDACFDTWLLLGRSIGAVGTVSKLLLFLQLAKNNLSQTGQIVLNSISNANQPVTRKVSFEFSGVKGAAVNWLDIDRLSLESLAKQCGFRTEIVRVEDDGNYLAVLRKAEL
ncbi:class I SAM-dependent methyltransferase [Photobacterium sp. J15]|uniref:class I SAM-dependent methyltransferase n=1 Tax=Photobacterium sp. J15 TaxID=265901 RepID=UPI0007E4C289|nr:SAM-dependent methyltransferase [Photobacterium sp. J15]